MRRISRPPYQIFATDDGEFVLVDVRTREILLRSDNINKLASKQDKLNKRWYKLVHFYGLNY